MGPTGHLVAATERPLGPPLKPHPVPRHGKMRQTCEICWRTRQGKQDRSMDRVGAPRLETVTVTLATNSAGPNTVDKTHWSYVMISPSTEAPHTHCALQMK